ncbi:hypothetical protein PM082_024607 [Marasmius tenuissimus]|nr:hypothetical protein PM082_024607 [Marasmius tenuissimus]
MNAGCYHSSKQVRGEGLIGVRNQRDLNMVFSPLKTLRAAVSAVGASHTAERQFERGECLEGTRQEILRIIYEWILAKGHDHPICWVSGLAGVGKSAVAMSIATLCEKEGRLASSFFFSRSDPKRNGPHALMLTIAHGLVSTTPSVHRIIDQQISTDPRILEASIEDQFNELVLESTTRWSWREWPRSLLAPLEAVWAFFSTITFSSTPTIFTPAANIVVIDGLDECSDKKTQLRVLAIIQSAFEKKSRFPLRFLICGRPESWIQEAFDAEPLGRLTKVVSLDDACSPGEDITCYYLHSFQEISTSPQYTSLRFPKPWPSEEDLTALVQKSSGQFVYAVTAVKFIKLAYQHPVMQLRVILEYNPPRPPGTSPYFPGASPYFPGTSPYFPGTSPYFELDALYHLILGTSADHGSILPILAVILILPPYLPPSPKCIELLLGLPPGQVARTTRGIHSLLDIRGVEDEIQLHHTLFRDFLVDFLRSGIFYVDITTQTYVIAQRWLRKLSTDRMRTYSLDLFILDKTNIFFTGWIGFCISQCEPTRDLLDELRNIDLASVFFCKHILHYRPQQFWPELRPDPTRVRTLSPNWDQTFSDLVSWIQRYKDKNAANLVEHLMNRLSKRPECFHLELSPNVSINHYIVQWAVLLATGCTVEPRQTFRVDSADPRQMSFRLADCHCDLSKGRSNDSAHVSYQKACLQLVKTFVSKFRAVLKSDVQSDEHRKEMDYIFWSLLCSSLLRHCHLGRELLLHCRNFLDLARDYSPVVLPDRTECRKEFLKWIETFPEEFAKEAEDLKKQFTVLLPP